jgi:hypothetical protein
MKTVMMASGLAILLLAGCAAEKQEAHAVDTATGAPEVAATAPQATDPQIVPAAQETALQSASDENAETGTWAGQVKLSDPVSVINYVGAESGDWVPMRFRNDSEAGRKILAACGNDDNCEFTGTVEFLDEVPPPDASAVAQIIRVESVKRLPAG